MPIITKFIRLPNLDKRVAIESLFWLSMVRIMIWVFPFYSVQKKVQKIVSRYNDNGKNVPMYRIRLMLLVAARYVPKSTCLVQALAGHILFSKYGYPTSIKIGVLTENGEFEAHAWLESDDKVVLGESEKCFKTIMDIGEN
ncbi:MAG: lasso peptide biosynthesis B2 protein [Methanobacterium formicicum]